MVWIIVTLCAIATLQVLLISSPNLLLECFEVKAFALDELTRRCMVRLKRTPGASFSIVSGRSVEELQTHALCAMPSFVGSGCWGKPSKGAVGFFGKRTMCEYLCEEAYLPAV
jgi:hypothetical protein